MLPYFRKAEDQERGADKFHGTGGPLHVSDQAVRWELADRWIAAAIEAGLPANDDFNGANQDGAGHFQSTTNRRRRWSTAAAHLRSAQRRPNLTVRTKALATRVLIEDGKATRVDYVGDGVAQTTRAHGEVIVCGGVFNSPQLLQLLGMGPAELLRGLGIPVVRDMPAIGADLQDHFYVRLAFRCSKPITMNDIANSPMQRTVAALQYALFRTGPLASNGVCAGAFARSDPRLDRPDLQLNFTMWSYAGATVGECGRTPFPASASVRRISARTRGAVSGSRARIRWRLPRSASTFCAHGRVCGR